MNHKKPSQKNKSKNADSNTGWGNVASWYDGHLQDDDTYHSKVIIPNLTRLVALKPSESLLELGCGQGFVLEKFLKYSTNLTGVDIGDELIQIAKKNNPKIAYLTASADDQKILATEKFDAIMIVLALQNMKNLSAVVDNVNRLLNEDGRLYLVLNHPAFRIPQNSDWLFDEKKNLQARRVDKYMSETEISIDMNPGKKSDKEMTKSFHRPMQVYSKAFAKHGFAITKIEEWISHKESQPGPRAAAENAARKEFPMFMCLEMRKM